MMGVQATSARLFYDFCLDDHVPSDHILRSIDQHLDLDDVRQALKPFYRALVQTFGISKTTRSRILRGSCGENCIPNFGRRFVFNAKLSEFELTFPNALREFNAGDGDRGAPKSLQSKHWTQTKYDRSMVLFD